MMKAKMGTASTNAANSRWSSATAQMATRLPTTGNVRYSASARSAVTPASRGVASTAAVGTRYGSLYSRFISCDATKMTAANINRPVTGPRMNSSFRFIAPFMTPLDTGPPSLVDCGLVRRSLSGGGCGRGTCRRGCGTCRCSCGTRRCGTRQRGCSRCQPLALELSYVGDDRPPVGRGDRPAVRGHQSHPVRHDVEDLPVRVLQDLFVVEAGGGDVAALEQDPLALAAGVVARLAVDRVALASALE